MKEHFKLMGLKVRDAVTGFEGVVTSISFDLYGCVQAVVTPEVNKDQKREDSQWFDVKRLSAAKGAKPVMPLPDFLVVPGGQQLPSYPSKPIR